MEKEILNGTMLTGQLRQAVGYQIRQPMAKVWAAAFNGEKLPEDHEPLNEKQVRRFLEKLNSPKQGRSGAFAQRAEALLKQIEDAEKAADFLKEYQIKTPEDVKEIVRQYEEPREPEAEKRTRFSALHITFYVNMAVAVYGFVYLLREMGFAFAVIYCLVSWFVLNMATNRHAQRTARNSGIPAVWVLELFTFFVHLAMFNARTWQAATRGEMPFDPIEHPAFPFWIAFVLAGLFSGAAIYAVSTLLDLTVEKVDAVNFESQHGIKY